MRTRVQVASDPRRRAQQYVTARDSARREDAALGPEVAAVRRTYETATAFAELQRDALTAALPVLTNHPALVAEIEKLIAGWQDQRSVAATSAADEIEEMKEARGSALSFALGCSAVADKVIAALGDEHPVSRELLEAKHLL